MLPSKNRLQAKKILQSSRSVVLSSAPVLTKEKGKEKEKGVGEPSSKETQCTQSIDNTSASKTLAITTPFTTSATETGNESAFEGQQYTYVTDESGYTWLYDNVYGQYYYYDSVQGTYIPYSQQGATDSSYYSDAQTHIAASGIAEAAKPDGDSNSHGETKRGKPQNKRRIVRLAGGQVWEDSTLDDWPTNDYRLFAGDLGPEVTGEVLQQAFGKFRTLQRTHVVMDKKTGKSRGYGFLSFGDADDFLAAWKEFNGKYVGSRPIKLRKSTWKERNADIRKVKRLDKRAFLEYKQGRK